MSLVSRFKQLSPNIRTAVVTFAIVVVVALPTILGTLAARVAEEDGKSLSALGLGLFMCLIGVGWIVVSGSYRGRVAIAFIGMISIAIGAPISGGGLAAFVLPHVNFINVWGVELLLVAGVAGVMSLIYKWSASKLQQRKQLYEREQTKLQRAIEMRQECRRASIALLVCAGVLVLIGLLL